MKKKENVSTLLEIFMNLINGFDCELDKVVVFISDLWFLMKLKDEFLKEKNWIFFLKVI